MRFNRTLIATAGVTAMTCTPVHAYEAGQAGWAQKPGITLGGASAGVPPPGLYMIDQLFTYQSNLAGHHQGFYRVRAAVVPALGSG
jgi:hypothetical protein